ncbi:hypothetical protein [Chondrinema litorale]|uniref:hypothetical protein n=1 Tax=Chondrinema litorale TaxID=2994555 RepID=UPI0025438CAE|nr:hypothetical protein [Chondrinema litorale]UZR94470.1 hypothetical protein OQ292_01385 [Chondrinema litorale]
MLKNIINISLVGIMLFLVGCDNPVEDIDLILDTDEIINTTIAVELTDALNGEPISSDAEISISGIDSEYVLNIVGERNYDVSAGDGLITLILHPDAQPSNNEPVQFTINVASSEYESYSRTVTISETGNTVQTIPLVNLVSPPSDVVFLESTFSTDNTGALTSDFEITSESANSRVKGLDVLIKALFKAGTKFLDENGNILIGEITVKFRASDGEHVKGEFIRSIFNNLGTLTEIISILPDTQLEIEISVDGVKAFTTTSDFELSFDFADTFTANDVKALFTPIDGSSSSIFDTSSSSLSSEGSVVFYNSSEFGTFDISKSGFIEESDPSAVSSIIVSVSSNIQPSVDVEKYFTDQFKFTITYKDPTTSEYKPYITQKFPFHDGSELKFIELPGVSDYKLEVFNDFDNSVIGSTSISSSGSISLNFDKGEVMFHLIGTCDDLQVGPTATVYYKPVSSSSSPVILGTLQSGKMYTYKLEQGVEYEFSTRFEGNVVSATGFISQTSYSETRELPANICDNF